MSELQKTCESKLGVVRGESLAEDMEGWGEELVLIRAFAPDGEWSRESVEIISLDEEGIPVAMSGGGPALDIRRCGEQRNSN